MHRFQQMLVVVRFTILCITIVSIVRRNSDALALHHAWLNAMYSGPIDQSLHDGIPDQWDLTWWGGATQLVQIERTRAFQAEAFVQIARTNTTGAAALTQDVHVQSGATIVGSVVSRGADGAIVIWFRNPSQDWVKQGLGGWTGIAAGADWHPASLTVTVPADMTEIKFLLQANGSMSFDDAHVGYQSADHTGSNLLNNSGFEQDGTISSPLIWWQEHHVVKYPAKAELTNNTSMSLSYLNVNDMLSGDVDAVRQRAAQLGDRCALTPEMTAWLLGLGDRFETEGGAAAREQLYQFAIFLAPNCPQPYAELAGLYESRLAYQPASELYHQAAQLSNGTILAGRYSFAEGYLAVRYTGDITRAISALSYAASLTGWEGNNWYRAATIYYLGQSLETAGRIQEALEAYQHILDCTTCESFQETARVRLQSLKTKNSSP
jgi:hypothetical protein